MQAWEKIRDVIFRSLYKLGYKIGQLFVQAGKTIFLEAITAGIRLKVREIMDSEEFASILETAIHEEMGSVIDEIASDLSLDNSGELQDPSSDDIDGALDNNN